MDTKTISSQIERLRKENNMTQAQLAEKLCVSDKAVSKWECGNGVPDLDNIGRLAEIFQISIDELLTGKPKDEQKTISEDEQVLQFQINSYEELVVYSSHLSNALINKIAVEVMDTITEFEEIIYLMDYFTLETLQKLCLYHKDKIRADTDLRLLLGKIDKETFSILCESK